MNLIDSFRNGKVVRFKITPTRKKWKETYNKLCICVFTFFKKFSLPMNGEECFQNSVLATNCCVTNYPQIWWLKTTGFITGTPCFTALWFIVLHIYSILYRRFFCKKIMSHWRLIWWLASLCNKVFFGIILLWKICPELTFTPIFLYFFSLWSASTAWPLTEWSSLAPGNGIQAAKVEHTELNH